jgi:hypothetical protein
MIAFFPNRPGALVAAVVSAAFVLGASSADAAVRYVNRNLATGANDGTSWENAYRGATGLHTALAASVSGDQIWVASGTYVAGTTVVRTASFTLKSGVAIYGGFTGTETALDQRNWQANVTTLSGDHAQNDPVVTDNNYHVVVGSGAAATAILDGFTIRGGVANGATASNQDKGGGLIVTGSGNPTFRNCIVTANTCTFGGGAGYVLTAGATFADCQFISNTGGSFGGAFDTNNATTKFERCIFRGNSAARAGAVETFGGANTTYTNCIFSGNTATGSNGGGALWIGSSGTVTARNCTFSGNTATQLAGCVRNTGGTSTLGNCILWGNTGPGGATSANQISNGGGTTNATYCIVQGGYTGTGNTSGDPLFVNAAGLDFSVQDASPAIDSGSNALVPAGTTTDIAGLPRFVDVPTVTDTGSGTAPMVDRGAYEKQALPPSCPADLNEDGQVGGGDLGVLLSGWGTSGPSDLNGDGFTDGADLGELLVAWGDCP